MKYSGKKILILGSNVLADEAVKYSKANGAYTVVTDYLPYEQSTAKQLSDENWGISTADIDILIDKCKKSNIDAVFSGISEFNLIAAMKISEGLGKKFYFNQKQWDQIEKKDNFRKLCKIYDVPTPKTLFCGTKSELEACENLSSLQTQIPVVVKPVDCAASDGVSICKELDTLDKAIDIAFNMSKSGRIIIEKFIEGYEFTAHYTIHNGKAALSHIDNRYPIAVHKGAVTTIPIARIYPSLFTKPYIEQVNCSMLKLCENIGLENAVVFIQGIYNEINEKFYVFEAGLRVAAEAPCRFSEAITGQNHYHMLIDSLMLKNYEKESDYDLLMEDPYMSGKVCGIVSLAGRGGTVEKISGLDAVGKMSNLLLYENRYRIGSTIPDTDSLRQIVLRFLLITESREQMVENIKYINKTVSMRNKDGEEMLIRMRPESVLGL